MKISTRKIFLLPIILLALNSCGDVVRSLITDAGDERSMGESFDSLIRNGDSTGEGKENFFLSKNTADSALVAYIDSIGWLVVDQISGDELDDVIPSGMDRKDFFSFSLIASESVNAFAVPGGFVYIYTEILQVMKSEAELVAVLGHELGHVIMHHSRDRMQNATAAMGASETIFGKDGIAGMGGKLVTQFALQKYGQEDELQADSIGVRLAAQANVNPEGIQDFFAAGLLDKDGNCNEDTNFLDVLSTHPANCDRVAQSRALIEKLSGAEAKSVGRDKNAKDFKQVVEDALGSPKVSQ